MSAKTSQNNNHHKPEAMEPSAMEKGRTGAERKKGVLSNEAGQRLSMGRVGMSLLEIRTFLQCREKKEKSARVSSKNEVRQKNRFVYIRDQIRTRSS